MKIIGRLLNMKLIDDIIDHISRSRFTANLHNSSLIRQKTFYKNTSIKLADRGLNLNFVFTGVFMLPCSPRCKIDRRFTQFLMEK